MAGQCEEEIATSPNSALRGPSETRFEILQYVGRSVSHMSIRELDVPRALAAEAPSFERSYCYADIARELLSRPEQDIEVRCGQARLPLGIRAGHNLILAGCARRILSTSFALAASDLSRRRSSARVVPYPSTAASATREISGYDS